MTAIPSAPVDHDTLSLLDLLAEDSDYDRFLTICETVAGNNDGRVSCNKVRELITNQRIDIDPRRYSSFWARACAKGGPMVKTNDWEICTDRKGKNSGKPQMVRRWVR